LTLFLEELLKGESESLIRKAVELAKKGGTAVLRLCLDRIYPPRKDWQIQFPLPKITSANEAAQATAAILTAVSEGQITPGEAEILTRTVQTHVQVLEIEDLAHRLADLEKKNIAQVAQAKPQVRSGRFGWRLRKPEAVDYEPTWKQGPPCRHWIDDVTKDTETEPEVDSEPEATATEKEPAKESPKAESEKKLPLQDSSWWNSKPS
jgi:hypothetical protein